MNWLAHTVLSRRDVAFQLGNILADPLKGRAWPEAPPALLDGMLMHKAIDKFTDSHSEIALGKSHLGNSGLLRGVALDVIYDHFLSVRWDRYVGVPREEFLARFRREASVAGRAMPERPRIFVDRLVRSQTLASYNDTGGVAAALIRVDSRLSPRLKARESASQYVDVFTREYDRLLIGFDQFFPQLVGFFDAHPLGGVTHSWLQEPAN